MYYVEKELKELKEIKQGKMGEILEERKKSEINFGDFDQFEDYKSDNSAIQNQSFQSFTAIKKIFDDQNQKDILENLRNQFLIIWFDIIEGNSDEINNDLYEFSHLCIQKLKEKFNEVFQ